jgi:hypothetical protein
MSNPAIDEISDSDMFFSARARTSKRMNTSNRWLCVAIPQTHMAKKLRISPVTGATKAEAEQRVRSNYDRDATKRPKYSD